MGHTPGSGQAFRFDAKRWTRNDQIVGVASLVLMISLFLPWFSASVSAGSFGSASDSASGTSVHGWLWLVFVIGLLILAYLVAFAGFAMERISLPLRHELLLLVATGLNLLLVLIAFFDKPGGGSVLGTFVKIGWDFGAFLALVAAVIAVVPGIIAAVNQRQN